MPAGVVYATEVLALDHAEHKAQLGAIHGGERRRRQVRTQVVKLERRPRCRSPELLLETSREGVGQLGQLLGGEIRAPTRGGNLSLTEHRIEQGDPGIGVERR